jgi:dTDP-4-amino-4,6-dideoxygalactose transaminase
MDVVVPFNKPSLVGTELRYVAEAVASGHISGDGMFTRRCRAYLEEELGVPAVLLTTSCTHALEIAALLLDIQPDDEIIVPAFTFVSTVNAFALRGARPVFIDIRPDTLNLDERQLERLVTSRTRAIVVVHYAGVACDMDAILRIAERYRLTVVEDNAHGLFGRYRGRHLGTFGALGALSFHETKNFTSGEGGALLVNDHRYLERAEVLREKGTDRLRFLRGEVAKYTWVDLGSSYLPSDILAAFLWAQLEQRNTIQATRCRIWSRYQTALAEWADARDVRLPSVPESCEQPYHLFYLIMPSPGQRQALIDHLRRRGIVAVFHYQPLHLSDMARRYGGKSGDCPVTEDISDRLVRLPFFNDLTEADQARVISAVLEFDGASS